MAGMAEHRGHGGVTARRRGGVAAWRRGGVAAWRRGGLAAWRRRGAARGGGGAGCPTLRARQAPAADARRPVVARGTRRRCRIDASDAAVYIND
jgi:hypothetical protein